jgi:hypothetical protein
LNLLYYSSFCDELFGYIRKTLPTEDDYKELLDKIKSTKLIIPSEKSYDTLNMLYFNCDFLMMEYFFEKYKKSKLPEYLIRFEYLFRRIHEKYIDFYDEMIKNEVREKYDEVVFDTLMYQEKILNDIVTISTNTSSPHKKIVFCYRYLINGWRSKDILKKLRKKALLKLFSNFQNEYAQQSDVELPLVVLYLEPIEDELYKCNNLYDKLNRYFTCIKISEFLKLNRFGKYNFKNSIYKARINNIDTWCKRTLEKIRLNIIKNFRKIK